jgi:hypothetical protein
MNNTVKENLSCISKFDLLLEPMRLLTKKVEKNRLKSKRKLGKFIDIETFIRSEMQRKKWKLFRHQRHYMKVYIYFFRLKIYIQ